MSSKRQPIALIGIGCRFPGGASDPQKFWELLVNGTDAIVDVPADRWDLRKFYAADAQLSGKHYCRQAGFLQEPIDAFDPLFFGISPREAEVMDPQQRLLLEVCYEAIEDAGLQLESLRGSSTGVFIGGFCLDNKLIQLANANRSIINSMTPTSGSMVMLSNRISYTFDWRGPSLSIDTACSSSLVAFHYACQSIWNGESTMAVAGGANALLLPGYSIIMSKGHFLAEHSRCKAFDADAGGYVRAEGAGIVLLKPLEQALQDGDAIYAVVRSTGVNQDGQTQGITVPNETAQEDLVRQVYALGGVHPRDIRYVEAHGTGTKVGDPKELQALHRVLSEGHLDAEKCWLGSVKTNIGHLEAAAGIAGIIKTALVLKSGQVPPNLHFNNPNPELHYEASCLRVPTQVVPLHRADDTAPVLASVNSFGYGGTNAHAVLGEYPRSERPATPARDYYLLPFSARSEAALYALGEAYLQWLESHPDLSLADLAYSLAHRRSHHPFRLAIVAHSIENLREKLDAFVRKGFAQEGVVYQGDASRQSHRLAFIYTGMGPQWWAMGRSLYQTEPVFRAAWDECDAIFKTISGWSLLTEWLASEEASRIRETRIAQPANFVLQVALTRLWAHWGIAPDVVLGHSVGEVASAYLSGALSLQQALLLSYHRARLQQQTAGKGTMLAVGLSEEALRGYLLPDEPVSIAAVNSPQSLTLSATAEVLERIAARLTAAGCFNRMLDVEIPYHSYVMEDIREELLAALAPLQPQDTQLPLYSSVTADLLPGRELGADYWWQNARQPVYFAQSVAALLRDGVSVFVEVGPHPVLRTAIRECAQSQQKEIAQVLSIRKDKPDTPLMLENLGLLYALGYTPNWAVLAPRARFLALPAYTWQRGHYWHESQASKEYRLGIQGKPFFFESTRQPQQGFTVELNAQFFPFLPDHRVGGQIVFPGAAYLEAALELHEQVFGKKRALLQQIEFKQLLINDPKTVQILHFQYDRNSRLVEIHSQTETEPASAWNLHARARLLEQSLHKTIFQQDIVALQAECPTVCSVSDLYEQLAAAGLEYGTQFRRLLSLQKGNGQVFSEIALPESSDYLLHPAVLDNAFQSFIALIDAVDLSVPFVPTAIRQLEFFKSPQGRCFCHAKLTAQYEGAIQGDFCLMDAAGNVLVQVLGLCCRRVAREESETIADYLYQWQWEKAKVNPSAKAEKAPLWIVSATQPEGLEWPGREVRYWTSLEGLSSAEPEHLPALDLLYWAKAEGAVDYPAVLAETTRFVQSLQLFLREFPQTKLRLFVCTQDTQAVVAGDRAAHLNAAPLWGLAAVLANEFPHFIRFLDPSPTPQGKRIRLFITYYPKRKLFFNKKSFLDSQKGQFGRLLPH